jgi:hypothetical protein
MNFRNGRHLKNLQGNKMGWYSIKIRASDTAFSLFIRLRDKRCVICGKKGTPDKNGNEVVGLQCSHFYNRRKESVRFHPDNCDAFCGRCHKNYEHEKTEGRIYYDFKLNQLGEERFNALRFTSHQHKQRDDKLDLFIAKERIKQLKGRT